MKKLLLLVISIGLFTILPVTAQNEPDLNELLERLNQNHMGSVHDVFSESEILLLRDHFGRTSETTLSPDSLGAPVFATEDQSGMFGNFMVTSPGMFNPIAPSPVPDFEGAGVINHDEGVAYVIDDNNNLWIASFFGAYGNLGMLTPPPGETFTGLEIDPTDGTLYGLSTDGAGNTTISIIDTDTLTVTPIGLTGLTLGIALMIDLLGNGYALDIDDDNLYRLNLSTGGSTLLGHVGFNANFGQGAYRDSSNGLLYMAAFNNDTFDSELRTVDPVTGATTFIGTIIDGVLAQLGWASMNQPVNGVTDQNFYEFVMSPVPTTDHINLKSAGNIDSVSLYNMQGQLVLEKAINAINWQLNIQNLSTGTYILKVLINGEQGTYKIIKQ